MSIPSIPNTRLKWMMLVLFVAGAMSILMGRAQDPWSKRFSYGDTVVVKKDIVYSRINDGKRGKRMLKLDLYRPGAAAAQPRPAILCFHGGGWEKGFRQLQHAHAEYFAGQGFVALTISYRLRPEVNIDGCLHDAKAAVRWLRSNAKELGVDPERIGTFGGSAGAHLAVMLGITADDPRLEGGKEAERNENPDVSSRVRAAVGMATPANLQLKVLRHRFNLAPDQAKLLSPTEHLNKGDAPLLFLHCPKDRLVPYMSSSLLVHAAKEAGVSARLETIDKGDHTFWFKREGFNQAMPLATAFFQKELEHP